MAGRILGGLDEFMLRIGHLTTLTRVARDAGPSWRHITREMAQVLSAPVEVSAELNNAVADYLFEKELCPVSDGSGKIVKEPFRYPALQIVRGRDGSRMVKSLAADPKIVIGWQDRNLADPRAASRVGAITWTGKFGSKTGLSHVCDWAQFLDLLSNTGQLSANARLLIGLTGAFATPYESWNPYLPGVEKIFIAFEYLQRDLDVFIRLAPRLLEQKAPLTKTTCREAFVEALRHAARDAEKSQAISSRHRFELHQQLKDLERSAKRSEKKVEDTSTAWHRTASRVETLTDLGLLEKGRQNDKEKYQYIYYPTDRLGLAVESLHAQSDGEDWVYANLTSILFGRTTPVEGLDETLISDLSIVVSTLSLPTSLLPISCLAVGIACLHQMRGTSVSLQDVRAALEKLPTRNPEMARLARGRSGTRAEFLSVNLRKIPRAHDGR